NLSGLAHTEKVRRVVERTEMMSAVKPGLEGVLVALQAVVIHHQGSSRDKIAGGRSGERRLEIFLALLRTLAIPHARILRVQHDHRGNDNSNRSKPTEPDLPPYPWTRQPVQHVKPDGTNRCQHMQPIGRLPDFWALDFEAL